MTARPHGLRSDGSCGANGHDELVVAAQPVGAFTAFPVCERIAARRLVLLNAMIPAPGETARDWWVNTGSEQSPPGCRQGGRLTRGVDLQTYFLHDLPAKALAGGQEHQRNEADIAFEEPCPFDRRPDIATTVLAGREDRFFLLSFQIRVARERLGTEAQPVPGGHLAALSEPDAVTRALLAGS
jgi:pimeloyl-ACP methyl ester carboxylesterase